MQMSELDDEISIIDLVTIIKKRRKSFYIVFLLVLALSVLFTLTVEPRYSSKAVIFIGSVGGVGAIESAQDLVKRLEEEYRVNDSSEAQIVPPYVSQLK
ncbi:MAG: Wzz/FepE/Etk N-terminal domain-containing protein, partial [Gammaproteobacteria bacterium]|nr:Wzz/FepE/Etk N-terminal domain-containing protein [Gammaproteobacteria bacterium]